MANGGRLGYNKTPAFEGARLSCETVDTLGATAASTGKSQNS